MIKGGNYLIGYFGTQQGRAILDEAAAGLGYEVESIEGHNFSTALGSLMNPDYDSLVVDLNGLDNMPEDILGGFEKLMAAGQKEIIVLAVGFDGTDLLYKLAGIGIKYFILSPQLGKAKQELESALLGLEPAPLPAMQDGTKLLSPPRKLTLPPEGDTGGVTVAVAGLVPRCGTTTQSIQLIRYLQIAGHSASYVERNDHGHVRAIAEQVEGVSAQEEKICFNGIDLYYGNLSALSRPVQGYQYTVYDFGVLTNRNIDTVFDKDYVLVCCTAAPWDLQVLIRNLPVLDGLPVSYFFSFTDSDTRQTLTEGMKPKADRLFFPDFTPDMFVYSGKNNGIFSRIIQPDVVPPVKKKRGFFRRFWRK